MRAHGWDTAMDEQTTLLHAFKTQEMQDKLVGFALAISEKVVDIDTGEIVVSPINYDVRQREAGQMVRAAMDTVLGADPVFVADDVMELVDVASESFEPEALWLDDFFVQSGFMFLERPMVTRDVHGKRFAVRALSWKLGAGSLEAKVKAEETGELDDLAIVIAHWSHRDDGDDYMEPGEAPMVGGSPLVLSHVDAYKFGDDRVLRASWQREVMTKLQVLLRFAQQEIAAPTQYRVQRPVWKRAASWRQIKEVVVLTLRKARSKRYEGEREVAWSHRFLVRGHWRRQPYKIKGERPEEDKVVHRQIWIAPYVKGDEDLPFVAKKHAVEIVR